MSKEIPAVELNDGTKHPAIGYGTYKLGVIPSLAANAATQKANISAGEAVKIALEEGYTMLDCAQFYENEADIGKTLQGTNSSNIYICSKIWTSTIAAGPEACIREVQRMVKDFNRPLDVVLIHWPVPGHHIEAYKSLQECQKMGLTKSIGISNYTIEDYKELMDSPGVVVKPVVNQIAVNPLMFRQKTIDFFKGEGVFIQAYRPLGQGKVLTHPTIVALCEKYNHKASQIVGRWLYQHGIIGIPKSENRSRIAENLVVFDFELSDEDMAALSSLTTTDSLEENIKTYRTCCTRDTSVSPDLVKKVVTID
eukprot:TRINITY_DN16279_c0_g1_i1.p1 TRINITY_DN16279_c0_g1~~TRINITY_DN16279_c0_g1_i1.p1  ORF type:complete len:310 (+),score=44.62 TRINITY_DN16279_c0_g1_i1:58-987(+)